MEAIKVDISNPDIFKPPEFKVLPPGVHTFVVAKLGDFEPAKSGPNLVAKVEYRCQDEDPDCKGIVVFENFVQVVDITDSKMATCQKINQQKMVQLCLACGVTTKQQIEETGEIPLMDCRDEFFKADSGVKNNTYLGETKKQSYIKKYLFEDDVASTGS